MLAPLFVGFEILFKKIWEEEKLKHEKHDKKLNDNNSPKSFPNGHTSETIVVESDYSRKNITSHILKPFQLKNKFFINKMFVEYLNK